MTETTTAAGTTHDHSAGIRGRLHGHNLGTAYDVSAVGNKNSKLRTAERLLRLIAVFCILSWRIFWMTMINRSAPTAPAAVAFTTTERRLLDNLVPDRHRGRTSGKPLSSYITKVARLGGYLARRTDPPSGNTVMWRGLARLTDIELGFQMARLVGN